MMRLDKFIAHCGFGSRKEVKLLIRSGRIQVNHLIVKDDDFKVDPTTDLIFLDQEKLEYFANLYIMLHKPSGVISATTDPHQTTVIDLIPEYSHRELFPLGRLDLDTEGLLILSDDGVLAHQLLAPKSHVEKEYYVEVDGVIPSRLIVEFQKGVVLEDDYRCLPSQLKIQSPHTCHVILKEGKFHQIKRMFAMYHLTVTYLKRIRFHTIQLDPNLPLGSYRLLSQEEISRLMRR